MHPSRLVARRWLSIAALVCAYDGRDAHCRAHGLVLIIALGEAFISIGIGATGIGIGLGEVWPRSSGSSSRTIWDSGETGLYSKLAFQATPT